MIGPTSRAGDIARAATERIDAFYLMGGEEKRLRAADEGLAELARVDGFAPAAAVVSAAVQAVEDPATRIAAARAALVEIATRTTALVAGTSPLASLALATIGIVSGPARERAAVAAFAALPRDAWTDRVAALRDTSAEARLRMAEGPPSGAVEEQATRAAQVAGLAGRGDRPDMVASLIDGLPAEPRADLLRQLSAVPGLDVGARLAGLQALSAGRDVGLAVVAACDDPKVTAAAGRIALSARPHDRWRGWAEPLLGGGDDRDAAVLRAALSGQVDDDAVACAMLAQAAAQEGGLAAVLAAPLQQPMADAAQHALAAREGLAVLQEDVPKTLGGVAAACVRQAESLAWPEDGLRALQSTLPRIAQFAKSPEELEIVRLLGEGAAIEAYEASTVLRGISQAVQKLSSDDGARLPEVAAALAGYMNYWVDEARAARAGVEAIERLAQAQGDPVRAACARFLLRLDDQVDVSNENERSKALIAGIEWLGENAPTRLQGGLGELARHLRSVNEDDMRDVRTGQMAADMMAEAAAQGHDAWLGAEAALLRFLAGRHAENVGERRNALFEAMEVQRSDDSDGAQRLARMGKAAVEAYAQPMEDKAQAARACLEQIAQVDRTAAPAATALAGWTRLRLYGDGARGVVAEQVMEAFARRAQVPPGAVAEAARNVIDGIEPVNVPLFEEVALASVEQVARGLGDERYVPEVVAATRASLASAGNAEERRERLVQGLDELARFQGDTFDQVVAASRLGRSGPTDGRIEKGDGEVVIGGVRVPRKA